MTKKSQDCLAAKITYQTRMGQHSFPKGPAAGLLTSQTFTVLLKVEGMRHSGKHGIVPTFLRCVAAIKFKMSSYFFLKLSISSV